MEEKNKKEKVIKGMYIDEEVYVRFKQFCEKEGYKIGNRIERLLLNEMEKDNDEQNNDKHKNKHDGDSKDNY